MAIINELKSGANPAIFGLPTVTSINLISDLVGSLGSMVFQIFVFLLTIFIFLLGMFFILFQFVIRFASLLFLSLLYPLVAPFALSKKTEGVVTSYLMAWVSFLIHQPAFILGYVVSLDMLNALLAKQGPSLGLLILYTGMLFFLGGINGLINRIFGNPWTALATNTHAAIIGAIIPESVSKFKQGMMGGGSGSIRSFAGRSFGERIGFLSSRGSESQTSSKQSAEGRTTSQITFQPAPVQEKATVNGSSPTSSLPQFTKEIQQKGVDAALVNQQQGLVKINNAKGVAYTDQKTGLTTKYFSQEDALRDGRKKAELRPTTIAGNVIDASTFSMTHPSPHNKYVTQKAKQMGLKVNPHITGMSSEDRVNSFLDLGKDKFQQDGISGVMVKRYGNNNGIQTKSRIIRIYTKENK